MDELRVRFERLDRIPVPDVWSEVERRLEASPTVLRTRRVVPVSTQARRAFEDVRPSRLLLAAVLIAVLVLAGGIAVGGLMQRSIVAPTADQSPTTTGTPPSASATAEPWVVIGSLQIFRDGGSRATLLEDGAVLVTGGYGNGENDPASTDTEAFDPAGSVWVTSDKLIQPRRGGHTATLLSDGRLLVAGGSAYQTPPGGGPSARNGAELYDPAAGTWTLTGAMAAARTYHLATLLPDGSVLVVGGYRPDAQPILSAEVFDPSAGIWARAGKLTTLRFARAIALLPNGRAVVFGEGTNGGIAAETFDPVSRSWTPDATLSGGDCVGRVIGLPDGRLLILCGSIYDIDHLSAELLDPARGSRISLAPPIRRFVSAMLLNDGRVLLTDTGAGEILDPENGTWRTAELPTYPGSGPTLFRVTGSDNGPFYESDTATLLRDGRVLVTIGPAAYLYDPAAAP